MSSGDDLDAGSALGLDDDAFLEHVADALVSVPGVRGVALGGSRAQGVARPDSDWDVAVYYRGSFDPDDLRALGWPGVLSPRGGWGRIFDGGGALRVDGRTVDVHYRDLDAIEAVHAEALAGRFAIETLLFHQAGLPSTILLAEVGVNRALRGEVPRFPYPPALRASAPAVWWQRAELTLHYAREGHARHGRVAQCAGLLSEAACSAAHAILAHRLTVVRKRRAGTRLQDFTSEDWAEIAGDSGKGFLTGGIRGLSIYSLTNFTATSAAVASAMVTAAFGVAEQAHRLRTGEIAEVEFLENAELVCLEAAVGALSSFVGQALIPVPVLGAVIGNTVGMIMHSAVSDALSRREAALIEGYLHEQRELDERLAAEHQELIDELDASMATFLAVLERAFSPDVEAALLGSVDLARSVGVETERILDSEEKTRDYFLG
ncbi:nucleotidyltransferase domain-containing protein [Clavibacter sp. VKM Ac-2872]|uniref:nucleotidyltransferase domain-containing protein n=1 Tax=Clavibacter sp. VKM Ac-2872 TaxID=2783812 RepID=UPI001E4EEF8C|nr:nucleotidyltransferase domain-containing protein [Clavibacter sp. VKM Ac-2872]